jgi:hypothetical protein
VNFEGAVLSNNIMTSASLRTIHMELEDFKVGLYIKKLLWVFLKSKNGMVTPKLL